MQSKVSDLLSKVNRLANQPSFPRIPEIEYDLLLQHLRDLYQELNSQKEGKIIMPTRDVVEPMQLTPVPPVKKEEEFTNLKPEEPIAVKPEIKAKAVSKSSINEGIQSGESLNSKLKATSKEVQHKLSTKPMKELIDLNKRYVVVSELFKGDADACAKAIHQIDVVENYTSAESYIRSTLFPAYQWNETSETVKLFLNLVRQKFGVE